MKTKLISRIFITYSRFFTSVFIIISAPILRADNSFDFLRNLHVSKIEGIAQRNSGPLKISPEQIAINKVNIEKSVRSKMPVGDSIIAQHEDDQIVKQLQDNYINGENSKYLFSFYIGPLSTILHLKILDASGKLINEIWEQQFKDHSVSYNLTSESVIIKQNKLSLSTYTGLLASAFGEFGSFKNITLGTITNSGSCEFNCVYAVGKGAYNYSLGPKGLPVKYSISVNHSTITWEFSNYKSITNKGIEILPMNVDQLTTAPLRDEKWSTAINEIQQEDNIIEPRLPSFGVVSVTDERFNPTLRYICNSTLPSDEVTAKLMANPAFLQKYSADAQNNLR